MEFGRVAPDELLNIDFSLPPDPQHTSELLSNCGSTLKTKIYVGCGRKGNKAWTGNFYPEKLDEKDFMCEYVKHFNSIELKNTFYQVCTPEQIAVIEVQTKTDPDFVFYPLMPQGISHIRRLRNAEAITTEHIKSLTAFGSKLGPSLLLLGENFSPKCLDHLQDYLLALPQGFRLFVELRNKAWFVPETLIHIAEILMANNVGFAVTDSPGRRDVMHMHLTTPHAYIRFVASENVIIDKRRLDLWCERINSWKRQGLKSIGFFISAPTPRLEPELCQYIKQQLALL